MLESKNWLSVQNFLKGTKVTRAEQDRAVDPDIAWSLQYLVDYKDPNCIVPRPKQLLDEDLVGGIDPNDVNRMDLDRGSILFLETWRHYVKKIT